MVTPWLENNPRAAKSLKFGRDQQYVVNPNGIAELSRELIGLMSNIRRDYGAVVVFDRPL